MEFEPRTQPVVWISHLFFIVIFKFYQLLNTYFRIYFLLFHRKKDSAESTTENRASTHSLEGVVNQGTQQGSKKPPELPFRPPLPKRNELYAPAERSDKSEKSEKSDASGKF